MQSDVAELLLADQQYPAIAGTHTNTRSCCAWLWHRECGRTCTLHVWYMSVVYEWDTSLSRKEVGPEHFQGLGQYSQLP